MFPIYATQAKYLDLAPRRLMGVPDEVKRVIPAVEHCVAMGAAVSIDTRRPVRLDLGDGRSMIAILYDGLLSAAVSFEPDATSDADRFVADVGVVPAGLSSRPTRTVPAPAGTG